MPGTDLGRRAVAARGVRRADRGLLQAAPRGATPRAATGPAAPRPPRPPRPLLAGARGSSQLFSPHPAGPAPPALTSGITAHSRQPGHHLLAGSPLTTVSPGHLPRPSAKGDEQDTKCSDRYWPWLGASRREPSHGSFGRLPGTM